MHGQLPGFCPWQETDQGSRIREKELKLQLRGHESRKGLKDGEVTHGTAV